MSLWNRVFSKSKDVPPPDRPDGQQRGPDFSSSSPPATTPRPPFKATEFYRYHDLTRHTIQRLYASPHYLDWSTQPDPFRRYEGAPRIPLPPPQEPSYQEYFQPRPVEPPGRITIGHVSTFLYYSMAISAWKEIPETDTRWSLRVNPSSGNLHPTETHLIVYDVDGLDDGIYHFRVDDFSLEQRYRGAVTTITAALRRECDLACSPVTFLLTTIFWREAWKYRDRAFRYCHHDLGHALGAIALTLRGMGLHPFYRHLFDDHRVAELMGLAGTDERPGLFVAFDWAASPDAHVEADAPAPVFVGVPNSLSDHEVPYPSIDRVYAATAGWSRDDRIAASKPLIAENCLPLAPSCPSIQPFWRAVRTRRSGVNFDGRTGMTAEQLGGMLYVATNEIPGDCFDVTHDSGGRYFIHLYLYVHRVDGLTPGLYYYHRDTHTLCPIDLTDQTVVAAGLSLQQDIAGAGAFAASMIADFDRAEQTFGERGYRAVHLEAGLIGQGLYLGAESIGMNATGMGAFFDDDVNHYLKLPEGYEVIYHFTVGKAVPDVRIRMIKSYPFEQEGGLSRIAGKADHAATAAYTARFPDLQAAFGPLGSTGLIASHAGFGEYRVDDRSETHVRALEEALTSGVNLIDTSANYGDGHSEMLIATVLADLISRGRVRRDEVVIVTKGGYIQGQNYERAVERVRQSDPFPDVVEYDNGLWHCIHPEFLDDQLHRSLERMNLEHVDVYLLHNPEYYLSWAAKHGRRVEQARSEYYRRIRVAFEWLETQVAAGTISYYGISSNTFPKPSTEPDFTSLEQAFAIAESVSADHHFRVIQLPINLFERGGVLERNQSNGTETVLEFAQRQGLGVLVNRPLNAILGDRMVRLADFPADHAPPFDDVQHAVDRLAEQENEFEAGMLPSLSLGVEQRNAVKQTLTAGRTLQQYWKRLGTIEHWNDVSEQYLIPRLNYALSLLQPAVEKSPGLQTWLRDYVDGVNDTLRAVTNVYRVMADQRSQRIHEALNRMLPESARSLSLAQKAALLLRSAPGVSTVLVGMRQSAYVQDVVAGLRHPPLSDGVSLWKTLDTTLDQAVQEQ